MSAGSGSFFKRHRMMIIIPAVLAAEFYVWWQIQQNERWVPQNEKKELFVQPLEYAKKLYGGSANGDQHDKKKSL